MYLNKDDSRIVGALMTEYDYKTFFDDAPIALLRTDIDTGKFLMGNSFAANILGCRSVEELLTKQSSDFYSPKIRNQLIRKLKKSGTLQDQEVEMKLPNGNSIWIKMNLRINCGGTCIECFMSDITELVELRKKELIKMQSLSEKIDLKMASLAS
jgi:PAS domain S-box-containing protein